MKSRQAGRQAGRGKARCFGQDLMRGEHKVGENGKDLTFHGPAAEFDYYRVKEGTRDTTEHSGTSIFDPVLCELIYRWFCPPAGKILDPFAGGSVRGIVASTLGRQYVGIDLSARQLEANCEQAERICGEPMPVWIEGDARHVRKLAAECSPDLIFSCPPYFDLEQYSDDDRDLSNMEWDHFLGVYRGIVRDCVDMLKQDRFACFVVGDIRDAKGFYRNLPRETVAAFDAAGASLYNEAVLITAVGSLPIRVGKQFTSGRKLGKTHQNVLIFCKGDPKQATAEIGPVECGDVPEMPEA